MPSYDNEDMAPPSAFLDTSTQGIKDIHISYVDNGFVVRAIGGGFMKTYVVQAESRKPQEIEKVLDLIERLHLNVAKELENGHKEEEERMRRAYGKGA